MQKELAGVSPTAQDYVIEQMNRRVTQHRASYAELQAATERSATAAIANYRSTGTVPAGLGALPSDTVQRLMGLPSADDIIRAWISGTTLPTFENYVAQYGFGDLIIPPATPQVRYLPRRI